MAKTPKASGEETDLVLNSPMMDLMLADAGGAAMYGADDAGLGSEQLGQGDIVLPRVVLLQAMSKPVVEEMPGAKAGVWWVTPYNRPAGDIKAPLKMVVVKIFPAQRLWKKLEEGGGIICEASTGEHIASAPCGLTGARLRMEGTKPVWEGGSPTDQCVQCVYGLGASAAASGQRGSVGGWLPKTVVVDGERVTLADQDRAPRCTSSIDALIYLALPAFKNEEAGVDLPADLIPAFISFGRSSFSAGRSLAGMIKMAVREPAFAKIYNVGCKKVTNDKGTFYVANVQIFGYANAQLAGMARDLFDSTKEKVFRADMTDVGEDTGGENDTGSGSGGGSSGPPSDAEPQPKDQF